MIVERVRQLADQVLPEIVELRHRLHRMPEIAGEEFETAAMLRGELGQLGIALLPPFLGTDVVGLLESGRPGRHVALRADIDALPIEEENTFAYASTRPGMMHGCGHDGHMAMLVGAAKILSALKSELSGTVRFVFQPGEEVAALGRRLVAAGALEHPRADVVAGLHGWPGIPVGVVATCPGPIMAAAAHFNIRIIGRGGHGSAPEETRDPLLAGCMVVNALQTVASRRVAALDPVVLSVCRFTAGHSSNVIPDTAELAGTTRTLSVAVADALEAEVKQLVDGVCRAAGVDYEFEYDRNYEVTTNDPAAFELARRTVETYLGATSFQPVTRPSMAAEDFSFYQQKYPGVYAHLGMGMHGGKLHNPHYDFNDAALRNGMIYLAGFALEAAR